MEQLHFKRVEVVKCYATLMYDTTQLTDNCIIVPHYLLLLFSQQSLLLIFAIHTIPFLIIAMLMLA